MSSSKQESVLTNTCDRHANIAMQVDVAGTASEGNWGSKIGSVVDKKFR